MGENKFRVLPGLPPYGPMAIPIPGSFGRTGREGYVVEFLSGTPDQWVGNFEPGLGGCSGAHLHPNENDVVVFSNGAGYVIDPSKRIAKQELGCTIANVWEVGPPRALICDWVGTAFFRVGAKGIEWHTRRLSLDGFENVIFTPDRITGDALDYPDWTPFEVDLRTGASKGGIDWGQEGEILALDD